MKMQVRPSLMMASLLCLTGCTGLNQYKGGGTASSNTTTTTAATSASTCQSIAVPAYIYPSYLGSGWNVAVSDSPWNPKTNRIMIMNPGSGPGTSANSDYQNIVTLVHKAGGKVYGYVYTDYGAIAMASVEAQIQDYISWYGVDGIFLDASSSDPSLVTPYYQPLSTYIAGNIKNGGIILNAGVYPDPSYAAITVPATSPFRIVVFENDYATFSGSSAAVPAWASSYPASLFMDIVYNTPAANLADALNLSVQRNVGTVYVTDQALPNPYGALPSYWSTLVSSTQAGCS